MLADPGDLRSGEVWVQSKAGEGGYSRLMSCLAPLLAHRGGSPVLPHDRPACRSKGLAIPEAHGLSLVCDPDGCYIGRVRADVAEPCESNSRGPERGRPDVVQVMLNPAVTGEVLLEFAIARCDDRALLANDEGGDSGGAGIDSEDASGHA